MNGVPRAASSSTTGRWIVSTSSATRPSSSSGTGEYEPMPPVFGPGVAVADAAVVARLGQRRATLLPSTSAKTDSSSPSSSSSITNWSPSAATARSAASSSSCVVADEDALAGREPVGLDDAGHPRDRHRLRDRHAGGAHHVLREALRALDLRRRGARAEDRDPAAAELVGDARDERRLGPDHDEVGARASARARAGSRRPRRGSDGSCPSCAMPGFPGAAWTSSTDGLCASFQASACSRPPEPTTRTLTRGSLVPPTRV